MSREHSEWLESRALGELVVDTAGLIPDDIRALVRFGSDGLHLHEEEDEEEEGGGGKGGKGGGGGGRGGGSGTHEAIGSREQWAPARPDEEQDEVAANEYAGRDSKDGMVMAWDAFDGNAARLAEPKEGDFASIESDDTSHVPSYAFGQEIQFRNGDEEEVPMSPQLQGVGIDEALTGGMQTERGGGRR